MALQWFLRQHWQSSGLLAKLTLLELFTFLVAPRDTQCKVCTEFTQVTGVVVGSHLYPLAQCTRMLQFFGI